MRRIAHISDLHFGRTNPAVVEGLVADLANEKPDLVVASGDFTMAARLREFREARAFLARLPQPWIGVPGNHDISPYNLLQRFTNPFARYRRYIAAETEPVFQDDEIGVVCLNTVRTWAPERDWSQGNIHREQIRTAATRLGAMPAQLVKIVVAHHPFLPPPWDEDARIVGRADTAMAVFKRKGVRLVLGGHLHRHYARFVERSATGTPEDRVDTSFVHDDGTRTLAVQAGSATSTRLRGAEPNAYNMIRIDGCQVDVTVRLWTGQAFGSDDARA